MSSVHRNGHGDFDFAFTCPYHGDVPCKYVIAVLLEAAERTKRKENIPPANHDAFPIDDYTFGKEQEEEYGEETVEQGNQHISSVLSGKSRDELGAIIQDLAWRFPKVYEHIMEASHLESGRLDILVYRSCTRR